MSDQIKDDLKKKYSSELVDALMNSYIELKEQYYLGKHEPSELNGGKFVEACARIIQQQLTGSYTPIGTPIRNMADLLRGFETSPSTNHESFRLHIPRMLLSIYDIRNRRGVGHLGGDVEPNLADATIISTAADWILAELYRMFYAVSLNKAQEIVNELVRRKLLLVHNIGTVKRILDPTLPFKDQTLLLLSSIYPEMVSDDEIIKDLEYSNPSLFKSSILKELHRSRMIEYGADGICGILPPGQLYVEKNYMAWLAKLNERK
jgi:hypothetical protein